MRTDVFHFATRHAEYLGAVMLANWKARHFLTIANIPLRDVAHIATASTSFCIDNVLIHECVVIYYFNEPHVDAPGHLEQLKHDFAYVSFANGKMIIDKDAWHYPRTEKQQQQIIARNHARARGYGAMDAFTYGEWMLLCATFGDRCIACKRRRNLCIDHVIPLGLGGSNAIYNIQPLCQACNSRKGNASTDYRDPQVLATLLERISQHTPSASKMVLDN